MNRTLAVAEVAPTAALVGIGYLLAHMVLHALHVANADPHFVRSLSAIPLFATCKAAVLAGLLFAATSRPFVLEQKDGNARISWALSIVIGLFVLEIVVLP